MFARLIVPAFILASLLWQNSLPIMGKARCGLAIPHLHQSVGQVSFSDLSDHQSAERACSLGGLDIPTAVESTTTTDRGWVISFILADQHVPASLIALVVVAIIPLLLKFAGLAGFLDARLINRSFLRGRSLVLLPPTPPPKFL